MEYNKRDYPIKNSVSHLESVPEVAVVQCLRHLSEQYWDSKGKYSVPKQLSNVLLHNCSFKG